MLIAGEKQTKWISIRLIVVIKAVKGDSAPYYSVGFVCQILSCVAGDNSQVS